MVYCNVSDLINNIFELFSHKKVLDLAQVVYNISVRAFAIILL